MQSSHRTKRLAPSLAEIRNEILKMAPHEEEKTGIPAFNEALSGRPFKHHLNNFTKLENQAYEYCIVRINHAEKRLDTLLNSVVDPSETPFFQSLRIWFKNDYEIQSVLKDVELELANLIITLSDDLLVFKRKCLPDLENLIKDIPALKQEYIAITTKCMQQVQQINDVITAMENYINEHKQKLLTVDTHNLELQLLQQNREQEQTIQKALNLIERKLKHIQLIFKRKASQTSFFNSPVPDIINSLLTTIADAEETPYAKLLKLQTSAEHTLPSIDAKDQLLNPTLTTLTKINPLFPVVSELQHQLFPTTERFNKAKHVTSLPWKRATAPLLSIIEESKDHVVNEIIEDIIENAIHSATEKRYQP